MVPKCDLWFLRFQVIFFGSRMFFMVFRFFKVPGWFFVVPDRSFWLLKVPGSFFTVPSGFYGFQGSRFVFHGTPKRYSLHLYLGPTIPLGLAGRWPALA